MEMFIMRVNLLKVQMVVVIELYLRVLTHHQLLVREHPPIGIM